MLAEAAIGDLFSLSKDEKYDYQQSFLESNLRGWCPF